MSEKERELRERIAQNDVTVARSYLEVDVMEWFSNEELPFAYEPFVIPSIAGPSRDEWNLVVDAIKSIGNDDFDRYDDLTEGTILGDMRPVELLSMWTDIYDKHKLQEENITIDIKPSLANYSKKMILPDFVIYEDFEMDTDLDYFDWSTWDYIVEVSGLWGVGLPDESTDSDWWDWYRVSGVAFKELAYKLLGIWEDVYWVIPNGPDIPGPIRDDNHFVIAKVTQSDLGLDDLADTLGITTDNVDAKLSAPITPAKYDRPSYGIDNTMKRRDYEYENINVDNVNNNEDSVLLDENIIMYHGDMGEVYVSDMGVFVRESQWEKFNIILLREYILDCLTTLEDDGIVEGLKEVVR